MKPLGRFLKSHDIFGHQVMFTINGGNGTEQTSRIGGCVALFIYAFVICYVSIKYTKMAAGNLDNYTVSEQIADFDNLGKVPLHGVVPVLQVLNFIDTR